MKLLSSKETPNGSASFYEQFISLDFSPNKVLPRACMYLQSVSSSEVYWREAIQANDKYGA